MHCREPVSFSRSIQEFDWTSTMKRASLSGNNWMGSLHDLSPPGGVSFGARRPCGEDFPGARHRDADLRGLQPRKAVAVHAFCREAPTAPGSHRPDHAETRGPVDQDPRRAPGQHAITQFSRTTKTGVRDFCDMRDPLAGPDRSQWATTGRRIGRKPRKFRGKFESMLYPEKLFYNNDLCLAEGVGFEPTIRFITVYTLSRRAPSATRPPLRGAARPHVRSSAGTVTKSTARCNAIAATPGKPAIGDWRAPLSGPARNC